MKSLFKNILAAAAVAGALSFTSLHALPTVTVADVYGGEVPNGGVFNATTAHHGTFDTFCLEVSETLTLGGTHYYTLGNAALYNGGAGPDSISLATAWLYRYYKGLGIFSPIQSEYRAVQEAIWFLEGEGAFASNAYVVAAQSAIGANWNNDANGAFGVQVMNLWDNPDATGPRQDILVRVPDQGLTLALVGAAFGLLAFVSRRKRA